MSPLKMGGKQVKAVSAEELTSPVGGPRAGAGLRRRPARPGAVAAARAVVDKSASARRRRATTPSSRSPAPPARASPACSTRWSAPTVASVGARRPTTSTAGGGGLGRRGRHRAARLALRGPAPPRGPAPSDATNAGRRGPSTGWCCSTCPTSTPGSSAPHRGRAGARARRRLRLGHRPAEVRRRPAARRLPARPGHPRRRDRGGAQPGRPAHAPRRRPDPRPTWRGSPPRTASPGSRSSPPRPPTGAGVDDLRLRLATAVAAQNAAQHRLARRRLGQRRPLRAGRRRDRARPVRDRSTPTSSTRWPGRRHPDRGRGRRARLPQPGLGPHRLAVHPVGPRPAARPAEAAAPQHPRRGRGEARRHRRRRAHGARPFLAAAADARRPLRGRPGHPAGRRPAARGAAATAGPRPSPMRPPRPGPSWPTPSTRPSSAPR